MSAESQQNTKEGQDSDITTIVNILKEIEAFCEVPGRTHSNVGSIPKDPISVLDFADLNKWLTKHKKNWVNSVSMRILTILKSSQNLFQIVGSVWPHKVSPKRLLRT